MRMRAWKKMDHMMERHARVQVSQHQLRPEQSALEDYRPPSCFSREVLRFLLKLMHLHGDVCQNSVAQAAFANLPVT